MNAAFRLFLAEDAGKITPLPVLQPLNEGMVLVHCVCRENKLQRRAAWHALVINTMLCGMAALSMNPATSDTQPGGAPLNNAPKQSCVTVRFVRAMTKQGDDTRARQLKVLPTDGFAVAAQDTKSLASLSWNGIEHRAAPCRPCLSKALRTQVLKFSLRYGTA